MPELCCSATTIISIKLARTRSTTLISKTQNILLAFTIFFASFDVKSQTYVYPNDHVYFGEMLCNIQGGHVISGSSNMWSDAILTTQNNKIFKGFSTSTFDVLYTLKDGKLYAGDSHFTFDIQFTIQNGKIYKADSSMMMDCLYTYDVKSNKLYKGDSTFALDAMLYFQGDMLNSIELLAMLLALELI